MPKGRYEPHEAADVFPTLGSRELNALASDIRQHGLKVPILLFQGKILDGRNRYKACEMAGVEPRFEKWHGNNPFEFVWSANAARRHLRPDVKTACYLRQQLASAQWERNQLRIQQRANRGRSLTQEGRPKAQRAVSRDTGRSRREEGRYRYEIAKAVGVSAAVAGRVLSLANSRPDLLERVANGEISAIAALRFKRRTEMTIAPLPSAKYRVIYADPPWDYFDKTNHGGGALRHFNTLSVPEICALGVDSLAENNAVLFLWTTSPHLERAFDVIRAWKFKYKASFVWNKLRHNFGHYNSVQHELLLVATRGSCLPATGQQIPSVISVKRTTHSAKPACFYEIIEALYPAGKRIELFQRGAGRAGWDVWGMEALKEAS